ncbi:Protein FMP42 [Zalerion maritima]|uniref:Protein FMP42 n=1 Tax=Zalerion maritima TaxID=339359 RepID=A0AAD5WX68_9PEZI|nr:Protein FMP42 [Zalerion maritima]
MSLNRVSSLETLTITHPRRDSHASILHATKLTFNPALEPTMDARTISANTIPQWKRIAQVVGTVIYCFLAAGVVFGFAALKPVLKAEGAYHERCSKAVATRLSPTSDNGGGSPLDQIDMCVEMRLNIMFTSAAVGTNVAALPVGAILDRYGPRNTALFGSVSLAIGSLFLAFAQTIFWADAYLVGYLFLALGGPSVFISSFHLSNAFPSRSGLVLSLLTGAFDASSAMFLGYRVLYERSDGTMGPQNFFLGYLIVPVYIALFQLAIMPKESYQTVGQMVVAKVGEDGDATPTEEGPNEHTALLRGDTLVGGNGGIEGSVEEAMDAKIDAQKHRVERSDVAGMLHGLSALQQMKSLWFALICLFTVVQMLRLNYFMATVRTQYTFLLHSEEGAEQLNHFFDIVLPLGGAVAIPFIGHFIDSFSTLAVLSILVISTTAIGILGLIPHSMGAGMANILIFVVYRPFYYTAVSDYCGKVFGFATFGTVYGTLICIAGLGNILQNVLDYIFHKVCHGNPFAINLGLVLVGIVVGIALVAYVRWGVKRRQNEIGEAKFCEDDRTV